MREAVLEVKNLTKIYKLYNKPSDRLKEIFFKKKKHRLFYANKNVTFNLYRNETLGIIGANGAGKSTLLKQIAGITKPTSGSIVKKGRVVALLELGTGFNYEMTGRENIFFNGLLIGMSKEEIKSKLQTIVDFSELGDFINEPLRTYSSGMVMRLAFSIAINSDPEILVVDEALSVGDAYFSAKCIKALKQLKNKGLSIIYVSHDLNSLKILCDRVILMNEGEIYAEGDPDTVIGKYNYIIAKLSKSQQGILFSETKNEFGNFKARIKGVRVVGSKSNSKTISSGEHARLDMIIESYEDLKHMSIGFLIKDKFGQDIFGTNTYYLSKTVDLAAGKKYLARFMFPANIGPGKYYVTVAIHTDKDHLDNCVFWKERATEFEVAGVIGPLFTGLARLDTSFSIEEL